MTDKIKPYPKNAPGPFVVNNGECMCCLAPEHEAPDLMAFDEDNCHCYFRRQPETPEELDRALRAVRVSCCAAVRYGGDDPLVLQRQTEIEAAMAAQTQLRLRAKNRGRSR